MRAFSNLTISKFGFAILVLTFSAFGCDRDDSEGGDNIFSPGAKTDDDFQSSPLTEGQSGAEGMRAGYAEAERLFQGAELNLAGKERAAVTQVHAAFRRSTIYVPPPGKEYRHCREVDQLIAFAILGRPYIFICQRTFQKSLSASAVAQVFIHESAHVAGVRNECDATQVEMLVMRASGGNLAFTNGYMQGCGFTFKAKDLSLMPNIFSEMAN